MSRQLSPATVAVLRALVRGKRYGFDIMDDTGFPSGTVYPILSRLETTGLVRAKWEASARSRRELRPRRRYYEVTKAGALALAQAIEHYRLLGGELSPDLSPKPAHG